MSSAGRQACSRLIVGALVALMVAAAGCGGTTARGGDGSNTFIYAVDGVPNTLEIWGRYEGDSTRRVMYEWGSQLLSWDAAGLEGQGCDQLADATNLKPELAESWERLDGGKRLRFTLREGVKSPAGNVMTAEDVKKSFDLQRKASPVVRFLFFDVAHFEKDPFKVVDERTLDVRVAQPTALDEAIFTWGQLQVLDFAQIEQAQGGAKKWLSANMATFGPWQLDRFDPGGEIVMTRNPNYWNKAERGNVDRLIIRNVPESSTRLQLLQAGQISYASRLPFDQYASLRDTEGVNLKSCVSPNRDALFLNTKDPRFEDVRVRKAISLAIDRPELAEGQYRGFAEPSTTGLSQVYDFPEPKLRFNEDIDEAKRLLADAGYAEGFDVTVKISPSRPGSHAEGVATLLQSQLARIGVRLKIDLIAGATEFSDAFFTGEYEAMLYDEPPGIADPYYSLNLYNASVSFQNTHGYRNDDYDRLTDIVERSRPGPEREAAMQEVSDVIVETAPLAYLVERKYVYAFSDRVEGFVNTPPGELFAVNINLRD
jgi:peptide/nickel transport system substrate-binding protein